MPRTMHYKNLWGAAGQNIDQQRSDLFKITLNLPRDVGGLNAWEQNVAFAVEKFPFPERTREAIPVKYMNQTNYQIGADVPTGVIDIPVRYAFDQQTAQALEKWNYYISNPVTGGVSLASKAKCNGAFYWLIPNQTAQTRDLTIGSDVSTDVVSDNILSEGACYKLEGCWIRGLRWSEADMTTGTGLVTLTFSLMCDRYYPALISDARLFS